MRAFTVFAAATFAAPILAAPAVAAPYVYYGINGPVVDVPLNTDNKNWIKPGVEYVTYQSSTVVQEQVVPFSWDSFPASKGTVTMQVRKLEPSGKLQWLIGITPAADAYGPPLGLALHDWEQLGLTISRQYGGETVTPVTRIRSEKNGQTQLHKLIFMFDTPLEKGKTTWFRIGTYSISAKPRGYVAFSDNDTPTSPWPRFPFARPVPARVAPPTSATSREYRSNPPSPGMIEFKLPILRKP